MLTSIGLRNFRGFSNETIIDLKPITVLVGKNSSGKSSFLRVFPLIRQSIETSTTGPILWHGKYVDYGDFNTVISKNSDNEYIDFTFHLKNVDLGLFQRITGSYHKIKQRLARNTIIEEFEISSILSTKGKDKKTTTAKFEININNCIIKVDLENSVNSIEITYKNKTVINSGTFYNSDSIFPELADYPSIEFDTVDKDIRKFLTATEAIHIKSKEFLIQNNIFKYVSEIDIDVLFYTVFFTKDEQLKKVLKSVFRMEVNNDQLKYIKIHSIFYYLRHILFLLNKELASEFLNTRYIAPLRATSERYYRFQDLKINEIDHIGSNVAMSIHSLSFKQIQEFKKWTKENFNFEIKVDYAVSHFAILIKDESGEYNISDMGFGYSQMIPIIITLWFEISMNKRHGKKLTFIIEQPELHLHPEFQYKLGKMFINAVKLALKKKIDIKIIFETHSQAMIESLSDAIESESEEHFLKDQVSILIFEKDLKNGTSVRKSFFDESGYIQDWPMGFFIGDR